MKKDSIILYANQWGALTRLTDEQLGRLFRYIFMWMRDEELDPDSWPVHLQLAFDFLTLQIALDSEKYLQKKKRIQKSKEAEMSAQNVKQISQFEQLARVRGNVDEDVDGDVDVDKDISLSLEKPKKGDEKEKEKNKEEKIQSFIKFWNDAIDSTQSRMRKVRILTPERRRKIEAIIDTFPGKDAGTAINYAMRSQYCNGETQRRAKPVDFDWLIRLENFTKALEGSL